jgi:D-3-phosphoglycerate dehydrogenase/(S)-sulfolactate dehydrogenase
MNIVISELIWPEGIAHLEQQGCAVRYDPGLWKDRQRLMRELQEADGFIVRNQTQVNVELLEAAPNLKVVGRLGVGLDNIDLKAAAAKGIPIVYGKNANATSVAEYVMSAIFSFARLLPEASADVRRGGWDRKRFTGTEISGKTLGLIGVGEISHRVAVRARTLGMRVIGYDPYVTAFDFPVTESGVQLTGLAEVISESDFISLHVPLTSHTRNLIDGDALRRMKRSAVVINSSRGGIVSEADLYAALKEGVIAGAVLDVLESEPPAPDHPLLTLGNCLITPHVAGLTEESQVRTSVMVANEVMKELEGSVSLCRVK